MTSVDVPSARSVLRDVVVLLVAMLLVMTSVVACSGGTQVEKDDDGPTDETTDETKKGEKSPEDEASDAAEAANKRNIPQQVFRLAISGPPITYDPQLVTDNRSSQIVLNTFEGLMVFDKQSGPVKLGVAESYTVSDDKRRYEFKLRADARWSDGEPVVARDFVVAWKRALDPETASQYAWLLSRVAGIKGARDFASGRTTGENLGVTAIDDRTLAVELEQPVPFFLDLLAFPTFMPIPSHAEEAGIDWISPTDWVSNGPYVFNPQSSMIVLVLKPNPHYWDESAQNFERVEVAVIEDDRQRIAAFDAGHLDWTGPQSLPLSEIQGLAARREFRQEPSLAVEYIVFNTTTPPLDKVDVRRAIALAVDRDELVIESLEGVGNAAYGFVPPMPGFSTKVRRRTDVDKARVLLANAGFPDGEGFPELTYLYPSNNSNAKKIAEQVQKTLGDALDITIVIDDKPLDELLSTVRAGQFELARSAWVADFNDPASFLGLWESDSAQNKARWQNGTYDRLLEEAAGTADRGERYRIYEKAELLLHEEAPVSPLFYMSDTYLLNENVEGFAPHKLNVHLIRYVSKTPPESESRDSPAAGAGEETAADAGSR